MITAYICGDCDGAINVPVNADVKIVGDRKCKICGNPLIMISNQFDDREIGAKI